MLLDDGVGIHILGLLRKQQTLSRATLLRLTGQEVVLDVVSYLYLATAITLLNGVAHRVSDIISIEDYQTVCISRGTSCYLRERTYVTQESLLVGIENHHKAHLGQIQTLTQEVYAHQHIKPISSQILQNLHAL